MNILKYYQGLILYIGMTLSVFKRVRKLPVANEKLNKLASFSEISFWSSFNNLVEILHGPAA